MNTYPQVPEMTKTFTQAGVPPFRPYIYNMELAQPFFRYFSVVKQTVGSNIVLSAKQRG